MPFALDFSASGLSFFFFCLLAVPSGPAKRKMGGKWKVCPFLYMRRIRVFRLGACMIYKCPLPWISPPLGCPFFCLLAVPSGPAKRKMEGKGKVCPFHFVASLAARR